MGLLDIFTKRDSAGATQGSASASVMTGEQAEQARLRARRRLIGAVVLLGIGVIAFPLLFETQPRPIAVDIPIVIPPRDGVPPLALPAPTLRRVLSRRLWWPRLRVPPRRQRPSRSSR
jgi:DedD protein